ncbi:MAG: tetratricopeptide repeat protein [Bauldia sp.]
MIDRPAKSGEAPAARSAPTRMDTALRFHRAGELGKAERIYRDILRREPRHFDALNMLGLVALQREDGEAAVRLIDQALAVNGSIAQAWTTRGMALSKLGRFADALTSLDRAIALHSGLADAFGYRGSVLVAMRRYADALPSLDRALSLRPDFPIALLNRALALLHLDRREEALQTVVALNRKAPDFPYALGLEQRLSAELCAWDGFDQRSAAVIAAVRAGKTADTPFPFLMISGDPADHRLCAAAYAADRHPESPDPIWHGERYRHDRIRLAYVSADFREHAVARLVADLIERHDRERFEVIAFSLGSPAAGPMRERMQKAFDRFIDAAALSDRQIGTLLREQEIDIAVDLMAFTNGCRPGIFAARPAPAQVNYLGYPGTSGAPYFDYVVGDPVVIPHGEEVHYSECVIRLPDAYQPNDSRRALPGAAPSRSDENLPPNAFVFCCFNNQFKIGPGMFAAWMRILAATPGSLLWLLESNRTAMDNLRRAAREHGISPDRLIFATRAPNERHLARHSLADLFLDTLPYGAHTTASDALWAGLPVLTCRGTSFPGRVASSLLTAIGLPEMIAENLQAYERTALALASDAAALRGIGRKLVANRMTFPLFDTDRYRRHFEAALTAIWRRTEDGLPPESFDVPPFPLAKQEAS